MGSCPDGSEPPCPEEKPNRTGIEGIGFSLGSTAAIASLGAFSDFGIIVVNGIPYTFISSGGAFGIDYSAEANILILQNYGNVPLTGENLRGQGLGLNGSYGPFNMGISTDAVMDASGGIEPNATYGLYKVGVTAGLPAGASITTGETVIFKSFTGFRGLLLPF